MIARPPLPEAVVQRIRRERLTPRPTQWDYLHLRGLQRALADAVRAIDARGLAAGPVLDLYCGTQPYREMIPWQPIWGLDIDLHFARAEVVGSLPLPFRDGAFSAVLCTQALYLIDDPAGAVGEMRRVLAPGGFAVVTVPYLFRRENPADRRYTAHDLYNMFASWAEVDLVRIGGLGTGFAYVPGSLAGSGARRWAPARAFIPTVALPLNGIGFLLDVLLRPLARRWPASLLLMARRGAG